MRDHAPAADVRGTRRKAWFDLARMCVHALTERACAQQFGCLAGCPAACNAMCSVLASPGCPRPQFMHCAIVPVCSQAQRERPVPQTDCAKWAGCSIQRNARNIDTHRPATLQLVNGKCMQQAQEGSCVELHCSSSHWRTPCLTSALSICCPVQESIKRRASRSQILSLVQSVRSVAHCYTCAHVCICL